MDDTIPLEDPPNAAPKTQKIKFHHESSVSIKSTQPIEANESLESYKHSDISHFAPEIENSGQENRYNTNEINTQLIYENLFLNCKKPKQLLKKFFSEKNFLQKSDSKGLDFSIKSVLFRLKAGYKIYKYNYSLGKRKVVMLTVENSSLILKSGSRCSTKLPFDCIYGVVLGCETMTFKIFKPKVDKLNSLIHKENDCFSILTDLRSYDFACVSDIARQDICIGTSWLAFHYSHVQACVPYTKCKY